ncbi:biotin-dependent carboxyltransferase [Roseococcus sp. SYP-B2431]|uniref:5-oxoprolinase subunit C family protein n=1 Tax=Roseococcus sp. SYP-B2431 TaxID=2496640 RepID=UPI00103D9219|nr:biotin-dependent carboxyltransferase family protein [Roseococcus sp. SYP-B2431]TCH95966.1 biotin-dependent carboxyltransferase [Roseococcus sp. SYP-B2431]
MSPAIRVVEGGLFATVQDLGRVGHQGLGVPPSGALDPVSLRTANLVVGNPPGTAALEMCRLGCTLEVEADSVRVALAGARVSPPMLESMVLRRGDTLAIGRIAGGACYLAVEGGFDIAPVLGSLSTYTRAGFGGLHGGRLLAGDRLPLVRPAATPRRERRLPHPVPAGRDRPLRVLLGPQDDHFTEEAIDALLSADFTVTPHADRMGLRLSGPRLTHVGRPEIATDGLATGALQVPGSGHPIALLPDRHTSGGYPKICAVIAADLHRLGQSVPGTVLRFEAVAPEQARVALARLESAMAGMADLLSEA